MQALQAQKNHSGMAENRHSRSIELCRPTTLDSSVIGFDGKKGIVALALTAHPDFDDTPLYDENNDGNLANDGDRLAFALGGVNSG